MVGFDLGQPGGSGDSALEEELCVLRSTRLFLSAWPSNRRRQGVNSLSKSCENSDSAMHCMPRQRSEKKEMDRDKPMQSSASCWLMVCLLEGCW